MKPTGSCDLPTICTQFRDVGTPIKLKPSQLSSQKEVITYLEPIERSLSSSPPMALSCIFSATLIASAGYWYREAWTPPTARVDPAIRVKDTHWRMFPVEYGFKIAVISRYVSSAFSDFKFVKKNTGESFYFTFLLKLLLLARRE